MVDPTFQLRPATFDDFEYVLAFCQACEVAVARQSFISPVRLQGLWTMPGFDLGGDTRLAVSASGEIVGYVAVFDTMEAPLAISMQLYAQPQIVDGPTGEALLTWAEARAREALPRAPQGKRVVLWTNPNHDDEAQITLLRRRHYRRARIHYKMQLDLDSPPPRPAWPQGMTVASYDDKEALIADLPAILAAAGEAFEEVESYVPRSVSDHVAHWTHRIKSTPDFDPSICYVVRDGGEIAGFCLCMPTYDGDPGKAHVNLIGVRPPWRRQGLALALLRQAFGEFYRRGKRAVDLGVEATNPTGATRLYERAGMRIVRQYDDYEKEIRGGKR